MRNTPAIDLLPSQFGFWAGWFIVSVAMEVVNAIDRAEAHSQLISMGSAPCNPWCQKYLQLRKMSIYARHTRKSCLYLALPLAHIGGLSERSLPALWDAGGSEKIEISLGSILVLHLWNDSYDSLLRFDIRKESIRVGYAVDVAALVTRRLEGEYHAGGNTRLHPTAASLACFLWKPAKRLRFQKIHFISFVL